MRLTGSPFQFSSSQESNILQKYFCNWWCYTPPTGCKPDASESKLCYKASINKPTRTCGVVKVCGRPKVTPMSAGGSRTRQEAPHPQGRRSTCFMECPWSEMWLWLAVIRYQGARISQMSSKYVELTSHLKWRKNNKVIFGKFIGEVRHIFHA